MSLNRFIIFCGLLALVVGVAHASEKKVLVYTRNYVSQGKGFVHDNIAASVAAIKKLGRENGFTVDASDDPKVFTDANLKQYAALVFSNSNNEAFENDAQREAFKRFLQAGGGFVGIHSASGSERTWSYFWSVVGGKFKFHPKQQPIALKVLNARHPATRHLPATFTWGPDECYFHDNLNPNIKVLVAADPASLKSDTKVEQAKSSLVDGMIPMVWCHTVDGARSFYVALGHNIPQYEDPTLTGMILGGIQWVMAEKAAPGKKRGKDATNP